MRPAAVGVTIFGQRGLYRGYYTVSGGGRCGGVVRAVRVADAVGLVGRTAPRLGGWVAVLAGLSRARGYTSLPTVLSGPIKHRV